VVAGTPFAELGDGMKIKAIFAVFLAIGAASAVAQTSVQGYTKKDGTYVAPHYRSSANNTRMDNYSTKGNVNPYTGKEGTKEPESNYGYSSPRPVQSTDSSTYPQRTTVPNPYGQSAPLPASQSHLVPLRGY